VAGGSSGVRDSADGEIELFFRRGDLSITHSTGVFSLYTTSSAVAGLLVCCSCLLLAARRERDIGMSF
jgi:hypothetical protein